MKEHAAKLPDLKGPQNLRPAFVRLLQVVRDLHGTVPRSPDADRIV